ncbi:MAG: GLPGLI family protein [Bacteroidota bacterium]
MARLLPRFCALALTVSLFLSPAQAQEGTVTYDITVQIEIELPPELEAMRDQIPSSRTSTRMLHFRGEEGLLVGVPSEESVSEVPREGIQFRLAGSNPDEARYTNLATGTVVDKKDFLGRTFRIMGEVSTYDWRLTGEQSTYMGYACQKAIATKDSTTIEAWFTPEIPVPLGPGAYGGLPGLILVVSVDDGQQTYTATEISTEPLAEGVLTPPEGGRAVTGEEFQAIVEEKMEEMGATRGRGGARFIIRN